MIVQSYGKDSHLKNFKSFSYTKSVMAINTQHNHVVLCNRVRCLFPWWLMAISGLSYLQDLAKERFNKDHELQIHWMTPEYIYPERNLRYNKDHEVQIHGNAPQYFNPYSNQLYSAAQTKGSSPLYHRENLAYFLSDYPVTFSSRIKSIPNHMCPNVLSFASVFFKGDRGSFLQRLPVGQVCSPENARLYKPRRSAYTSNDYMMMEVSKKEEAGIVPHPDVDNYMKVYLAYLSSNFCKRTKNNPSNRSCSKGPWIDVYADTMVGDDMRGGISRGQNRRLTTGEMVVVPTKALFMDEISNCLDNSTAYQIVACLQQLVHITDATLLISLLQPAPETFELFDDIILMAEGKVVYQGSHDQDVEFFKDCGFRCPQRKGVADFLQ
ncbi:hypothetical protein Patl1_24242 [Pistacia atlantica]|uniref:Uncharacterized protein n=1 Tax=Pistacia atlantica TaxID=434234 RepID=A0ACC1A2H2_9ROSI|nr:hypothetical protein Patl1_24242 [Pistacia atlantica]